MATVLLLGCAPVKKLTKYNSGLVTSYAKPTFEPMMFDQYKNAHPEPVSYTHLTLPTILLV